MTTIKLPSVVRNGARMATAIALLIFLSSCKTSPLEVKVSLNIFGGMLFVRNIDSQPLTISKVTINGKLVAENWLNQMGGKGPKFKPKRIEEGEQVVLWVDGNWPRPERVTVETDRGTFTSEITYQ